VDKRQDGREAEGTRSKGPRRKDVQPSQLGQPNGRDKCFVGESEDWDDVSVLWLGDELGDNANIVQGTLGIRYPHYSVQEIDLAVSSRMVEG
jgi:hypothetical protein